MAIEKQGSWPEHCVQRAFVEGVRWWQFHHNGSTLFPSERDEAEREAVRRYADPSVEMLKGNDAIPQ
jgi:hypothetical protein